MLWRPVSGVKSQSLALPLCVLGGEDAPPRPTQPCTCVLPTPLGPRPPELLVSVGAAPAAGTGVGDNSAGFGGGTQGRCLAGSGNQLLV